MTTPAPTPPPAQPAPTGVQQRGMPEQTPARGKTGIAVRVDRPVTDLDAAWRFALNIATAEVLPFSLRGKPADVFAVMGYGAELGLSPWKAFQGIYVVRGKPQLAGDLYQALILKTGHKVRWGACDNKSATVTIIRIDDPKGDYPITRTFTIEDAVQAGLCTLDKDGNVRARSNRGGKEEILPWERYTQRMLENRALSFAAKKACPEVAFGFGVEGDYDYIDTDATDVEVTQPDMHREPMSQTDLQQAFAAAEQDLGTVDAEVVDEPSAADSNQAAADAANDDIRRDRGTMPPADDDATLFGRLDEQAAQDLNGDRDE